MNFIQFQKTLSAYPAFSLADIRINFPHFQRIQLDRWEKKEYLIKLRREFYAFANRPINQFSLFSVANKIYPPSYISLQTALKFYGLIPEEVFQVTSVSSRKTQDFSSPIAHFTYRHIKPELFFGYRLLESNSTKVLIAEPEKALLDYFYLHPHIKTDDDFEEMRLNEESLQQKINFEKFDHYLRAFDSPALAKRGKSFLKYLKHDQP